MVFWCFQGVYNGNIGKKWVKYLVFAEAATYKKGVLKNFPLFTGKHLC